MEPEAGKKKIRRFQGLMTKAWGHLCHNGTELEIAERRAKLSSVIT